MKRHLLTGLAVLAFSAAASAQSYGVVSVGSSKLNLDCSGATVCDTSGVGVKLLGGYKFTPNLAAELGYFNFGKAKAADSGISLDVTNTAFGAGLAYHQDFAPDWNFVARLGVAAVKTRVDAVVAGLGAASDSDNNTALYGGLGVGYKLSKTMSLDAAWDFSKSKYNKNGVDTSGNINMFSVGATFGF